MRDNGGGCSIMFVFYLHMDMGKTHWREKGDPIINRIKIEIFFYVRDICLITLFFGTCFYLVLSSFSWYNSLLYWYNKL